MRRRSFRLVATALSTLVLGGCVVRHGDFTVISNKVVRLSHFELDRADRVKGVTGEDVRHIVLFIPLGGPPTLEAAIDDASEKGGGDVLTDAAIHAWAWYIPFVYGQSGWRVKGDVVKTRGN